MGELEIFVTERALAIRHATGLTIENTIIPRSDFTPMSKEGVASLYKPDSTVVDQIVVSTIKEEDERGCFPTLAAESKVSPDREIRRLIIGYTFML